MREESFKKLKYLYDIYRVSVMTSSLSIEHEKHTFPFSLRLLCVQYFICTLREEKKSRFEKKYVEEVEITIQTWILSQRTLGSLENIFFLVYFILSQLSEAESRR